MPEEKKHPGGRPRIEVDLREVEELARIGCSEDDMGAVLGVSHELIRRRKNSDPEFRAALEKGRATTRNSLRRLQLKQALQGNKTMLIWLGKQLLGQTDRQTTEVTGAKGERLIPSDVVVNLDEDTRTLLRGLRARLAPPGQS